jgi:RNA polymerase sigma factor (sigma-70 family)
MAQGQLGSLLQHIRRLIGAAPAEQTPDALLLEQFRLHRDETAFTTLVQRHGPLVLGVCRRMLRDAHEAEDAFQATFLVLARKAGAIRKPEALSSWLHGVAARVASRARSQGVQRRSRESQVMAMTRDNGAGTHDAFEPATGLPEPPSESVQRELRSLLDEELARLPDKYRLPMVLCYLEGKSNEEAAAQLQWTKGTVSGRLARARDLLRGRLVRRGLACSSAALVGGLVEAGARAAVPVSLETAAVDLAFARALSLTASSLAHGVLQAMLWGKIKMAALPLLVVGLGAIVLGGLVVRLGAGAELIGTAPPLAQATETPVAPNTETPLAPDTAFVVFIKKGEAHPADGKERDDQVWIADADGKNARALTKTPGGKAAPCVSPDGKTIAFMNRKDGCLYTMTLDGGDEKRVSMHPTGEANVFTADGKGVAYLGAGKVNILDIETRQVATLPIENVAGFALHPDGKRLAFTRYVGTPHRHELYLADLDGQNETKLLSAARRVWRDFNLSFDPSMTWYTREVAFLPDGKLLLVSSRSSGDHGAARNLHRADIDAKKLEWLGPIQHDLDLAVSPDGSKVLYSHGGPHHFAVNCFSVDDKKERQWLAPVAMNASWGKGR